MKKNLYAKVMTSAALLSAIALPAQAATELTDIQGSYAKDAIQELVDAGILNGTGNGKFNPTGKIQRQDFAIILAKALSLDIDQVPASATFSDVPTEHYAYAYVEAAKRAGLISGYGNGVFGTGNQLSRQDMAVIFVRALGVDATGKGADLTFSDADSIADYAKDAVAAAVELGLLSGTGNGRFDPTGNAERQAVALVASNFLKKAEEYKSQPPAGDSPSSDEPTTPPAEADKPVVPTTPSTPSVPSSGGSSGGGSSSPQPDVTAPTVTLLSSSPVTIGGTVAARSSESGTLYLIPGPNTPRTRSELDSLSSGRGVAAASANETTLIPTSGLSERTYRVFAVDAAGNVSTPSDGIELVEGLSELNLSVKPEARFWLNSGASTSSVLLDSVSSDPLSHNTRNINDLIEITEGTTPLRIGDYLDFYCFEVLDSSNHKVANLVVESKGPWIELSEDPTATGMTITPVEAADQDSEESLVFTLWSDSGRNLGSTELPIIFDEEPPTVTDSTYVDGGITLQFDEEVLVRNLILTYSSDDFASSEEMRPGHEYNLITLDHRTYRIELTTEFLSALTSPVKVRIKADSVYDHAGNRFDPMEIIEETIN